MYPARHTPQKMAKDDLTSMMRNYERQHSADRTFQLPNNSLPMTLTQPSNDFSLELDNMNIEAMKEKLTESNGIVRELMWRINSMILEMDKVNTAKTRPKHVCTGY
jgi:hypothetical protein